MNNLTTLEDLNEFLSNKLENEFKNFNYAKQRQKINKILAQYNLSNDEFKYANPFSPKLFACSTSHQKTMINVSKAKAILLKRKK